MICHALDDDFEIALRRVTWMPAHGAAHTIGHALDSRGKPIIGLMWRANRLVDVLAKSVASTSRLPRWATAKVQSSAKLVQHHAARLGTVTYEANNYVATHTLDNGEVVTRN